MTLPQAMFLLVLFEVKHFAADFPLQNAYMLRKKDRVDWELPLAAHCAVHALLTFFLLLQFGVWAALTLSLAEGMLHFVIDRLKAHPDLGGQWGIGQSEFWVALGADQLAHHLTYIAIVALLAA